MIVLKRPRRESFRLDITPLINIVFLLLIFFMLTSTAVNQGMNVDLPEAETAERINTQETTLTIGPDGSLMLDNQALTLDELSPAVQAKIQETGRRRLVIQADESIQFEQFGRVLDKTREAGAVEFLIATDTPESESSDT